MQPHCFGPFGVLLFALILAHGIDIGESDDLDLEIVKTKNGIRFYNGKEAWFEET